MQDIEAGTKIQYRLFDKAGKEHWFDGFVHGVRSYEDKGFVRRVTYLIDTGRHTRLDKIPFDHRDREANRQIHEHVKKGATPREALAKVLEKDDLPKSKLDVEVVRQPEQIELPAEHIRLK